MHSNTYGSLGCIDARYASKLNKHNFKTYETQSPATVRVSCSQTFLTCAWILWYACSKHVNAQKHAKASQHNSTYGKSQTFPCQSNPTRFDKGACRSCQYKQIAKQWDWLIQKGTLWHARLQADALDGGTDIIRFSFNFAELLSPSYYLCK